MLVFFVKYNFPKPQESCKELNSCMNEVVKYKQNTESWGWTDGFYSGPGFILSTHMNAHSCL